MTYGKYFSGVRRALIIHHWDADGVCSASLLRDTLANVDVSNLVPRIGVYRITERILDEAAGDWDTIIVADLRLAEEDFRALRNAARCNIVLFDHHFGNTPEGVVGFGFRSPTFDPDGFPSTTWMVKELLHLPTGLRCLLGIVGDKGTLELPKLGQRKDIAGFLSRARIDQEVLGEMVEILNSSARVGDESLVEQAVMELSRIGEDPKAVLNHPLWRRNAGIVEKELVCQLAGEGKRHNGVVVKEFRSEFDIVSAVARRMAWAKRDSIVVAVNSGFLEEHDQVYVRSGIGSMDVRAIIKMAHSRGYSAGGKEEVVGIVVPKAESKDFLRDILSRITN